MIEKCRRCLYGSNTRDKAQSDKYTVKVKKVAGKWEAHLKIGAQGFGIAPLCDIRKNAEWYADQLRAALASIVKENK